MPIEINELVIKATVTDQNNTSGTNNGTTANDTANATPAAVEKAVKEIMNILKRKNER